MRKLFFSNCSIMSPMALRRTASGFTMVKVRSRVFIDSIVGRRLGFVGSRAIPKLSFCAKGRTCAFLFSPRRSPIPIVREEILGSRARLHPHRRCHGFAYLGGRVAHANSCGFHGFDL